MAPMRGRPILSRRTCNCGSCKKCLHREYVALRRATARKTQETYESNRFAEGIYLLELQQINKFRQAEVCRIHAAGGCL